MNQQFCTLMNIVLVSRLVFLHRDTPLTMPRAIGMVVLQITGLFLFEFSGAWTALAIILTILSGVMFYFENSLRTADLIRPLVMIATAAIGSVYFSSVVNLDFSGRVIEFVHNASRYTSLLSAPQVVRWSAINLVTFGLLIVISEANSVIRYIFNLLRIAPSPKDDPRGKRAVDSDEYKAGRAIGILERMLIYLLVLKGQYAAIGIVLVAKGFTRFKELDERRFAEYVLIGTLLSTLLALLVGEFIGFFLR